MTHPLPNAMPVSQRIATLDIVRGFALLGILIMNMPGFVNSFFIEADGSHLWTGAVDRSAEFIRDMLFSGKFNSMFSLLFGIGFTIQYTRMCERDPTAASVLYLRRLLLLLTFGLVHALLVWPGDVLHIYAILGLLMLALLRRVSDRAIFVLIGLCLLYPGVSGLARLWLMSPEITARLVAESKAFEASNNLAFGRGSLVETVRESSRVFVYFYENVWAFWGMLGFYVQMMTTMLIGLLIGRHNLMRRIPEFMPWVRRLQGWALGVGIVCAAVFSVIWQIERAPGPSPWKVVANIAYVLSRLCLMGFYVLTIVRLAQLPAWQLRLAPMAAAGRMPLTNYLMQSLICTALSYGWGLGLWGRVGPAAGLAAALVIFFLVQVPLSRWWLRRHDHGPLEYLWRVWTYGHRPPARAAAGVPPATG